jgi:hypothetical protein
LENNVNLLQKLTAEHAESAEFFIKHFSAFLANSAVIFLFYMETICGNYKPPQPAGLGRFGFYL